MLLSDDAEPLANINQVCFFIVNGTNLVFLFFNVLIKHELIFILILLI